MPGFGSWLRENSESGENSQACSIPIGMRRIFCCVSNFLAFFTQPGSFSGIEAYPRSVRSYSRPSGRSSSQAMLSCETELAGRRMVYL
jgi:hypothetical protein